MYILKLLNDLKDNGSFLSFCIIICLISTLKLKRKKSRKEKKSGHASRPHWLAV